MRDSFVFYRSFAEAINKLDKEDRLAVYEALCKYALDGIIPEENGVVGAMLTIIIPQIDANNKKYENGKKGGRPKTEEETNNNQSETKTEPNDNQTETKQKPNRNQTITKAEPNVNVNVNDNVNDNENVNENDIIPPISPTGDVSKGREKNQQAEDLFDSLWKLYPKKKGKGGVSLTQKKKLLTIGYEELSRCIDRFIKDHANTEEQYLPYGSTFFNSGYVDYLDENFDKPLEKPPDPPADDDEEISDEEWFELQRKLAEQENEIHTV